MNTVLLLVGIALVIAGRRLFWLLVAAVGFVGAYFIAQRFFETQTSSLMLIIAICCALLGAFLAIALQKIAVGAAGFFAGGILLWNLGDRLSWHFPTSALFVIGGVVGALLAGLLFEWALIVISSLTGSYLIVREMNLGQNASTVIFLLLAGLGVILQSATRRKRAHHESAPAK